MQRYPPKARSGGFPFEVNPLILQIVLWNESEILDEQPKFATLSHPARVAEICKQLFFVTWQRLIFDQYLLGYRQKGSSVIAEGRT